MNWKSQDIFSLGVTLFSSFYYLSPFKSWIASEDDESYRFVVENEHDKFWKHQPQTQFFRNLVQTQITEVGSLALERLIFSMLLADQHKRPNISAVKNEIKRIWHQFAKSD